MSTGALWLVTIVYLPFALLLVWRLWKAMPLRYSLRIAVTAGALLLASAIPFVDVARTSIDMARLCPQAGVFVKRAVHVDGFYTNLGTPDMLDRGFKYLEARIDDRRLVLYRKDGSSIQKSEIDAAQYIVRSRYEFLYDVERGPYQGRSDIGIQKSVVRDRQTKEELGYALRFTAYPGWVDQLTTARLGKILWSCEEAPAQSIALLEKALLPVSKEQ